MRSRPMMLALLLGVGCATAPRRAPEATEAAVRSAMDGFLEALRALDVERMDAAFTDDVTAFVPVAQAEQAVGRAAVTQIFRAFADRVRPTTPRLRLVPEDERVIASSSVAVVTFQIRETTPAMTRRRTFVFRLVGDRWLIGHFHASDLTPPSR